jgi:hypothetical protein
MDPFVRHDDVIPFARRSARYLYRHGYGAEEVARALTCELDLAPAAARHIAVEERRHLAAA